MKIFVSIVLWFLLSSGASSAFGQVSNDDLPRPNSAFARLFPNPTGRNGYEDLVRAGDALLASKLYQQTEFEENDVTLAEERAVLNDPSVQNALSLLELGLSKPIFSPQKVEEMDENTVFPQYALFRALARFLAMKTDIDAGDGRTDKCIQNLEMGLQLGYATGQDVLISGLVGIAIDAIGLSRMSNYVSQLSKRDCDRLLKVLEARLALPSRAAKLFQNDRDVTLRSLHQSKDLLAELRMTPVDDEDTFSPEEQVMRDRMLAHPEEAEVVLKAALVRIETTYDAVIANAKLPVWQRKTYTPAIKADTNVAFFSSLFSPSMTPALDKFDQNRASIQLLALQVAIRRFRWEQDRLPKNLAELKRADLPADLFTDPYTGEPLLYSLSPDGETYDLHAAGALLQDEQGKPTGERSTVYLPYRSRS